MGNAKITERPLLLTLLLLLFLIICPSYVSTGFIVNSNQPQILCYQHGTYVMFFDLFDFYRNVMREHFFFQVAATSFAIFVFTGNVLTASKAFVALSLFNVMRFPLVMLPDVIVTCIQVGTC